ncbi:two-component system activity regulator YycH, partial [Staphylococcus epidermidis]|uniref:two-component system activity regulator YycH n=1 Tax=Staphylococcus epidermidis TaxID=1282 RepID=UPI001C935E15
ILFDHSTILPTSQTATTTYNNNTPLPNYNHKHQIYHYNNLSEHAKTSSNIQETIPATYHFINTHPPFLNQHYPLFKTHNTTPKLTYQPFLNPYPT